MSLLSSLMTGLPFLAAAGGSEGPSIAEPLFSHWLWTWIIFALVFFILWKFAWRPLREQLEARENRIRETVDKADEVKTQAEALLEKHKELMDRAKADAQQIIDQGREAAERSMKDHLAKAQSEAEELRERAGKEIELHKLKALDELRRETVDLTIMAASRLLERSLSDDDHRKMTEDVIDELGHVKGEG
jgi:F-type H+-transporting ATPase subunit b